MCHLCGNKSRRAVCKNCIESTSKTCEKCGKPTPSLTCMNKPTKSPYCLSCRHSIRASKSRGGHMCQSCGKKFAGEKHHRICQDCMNIKIACPQCKNEMSKYRVSGKQRKYCSMPCVVHSMTFDKLSERSRKRNVTLWSGYERKTSANKAARKTRQYKEWREAVYKRDNYTCQECGAKSGNGKTIVLHPHHIQPFATFPELRYEVSNGITLCDVCHRKRHNHIFIGKTRKHPKSQMRLPFSVK